MTSAADGPHPRVAFVASEAEAAQAALAELRQRYGATGTQDADIIVPLGGDGFMLETLHRFVSSGRSIFGMHRGSVGFLMNPYRPDGLHERLAAAQPVKLHPLEMAASQEDGSCHRATAFNEREIARRKVFEGVSSNARPRREGVRSVGRLVELLPDAICQRRVSLCVLTRSR